MNFERKLCLQKLISAEGNGMIKIITGIRRCGKSYLLFNIFKQNLLERGIAEDHIVQINLEDRRNKKLRNPDKLMEHIDHLMVDKQKYYILLDEIQLVPEFEDVLNSYLHIENAEVYVTGSNAKFLSKDIVTEFRGRGWEIRVFPLSFAEYYESAGGEKAVALETYYLYGGLPGVYQCATPAEKQNYLREVYETVYLRDVIDRNHLHNEAGLKELVRILASCIGSSTNVRRISNTFKTSNNVDILSTTIMRYLELLQDAFIISEALRYNVKGRKYIGTETKYYFEDVGIRNAILGFRQVEENHIMENVVYNELRQLGFSVDVGLVEAVKRNEEGKVERLKLEIDFVVNKHDRRLYIQSAYMLPDQEKINQEQASLLNISDNFKKVIIVGNRYYSNYNEEGIFVMGIFDFLLQPDKL
ncbi:MAG: ATP-binding protein [Paludibacteraceae bacterium]